MSDNGYMIWFVATAAMIVAVITIGTLAAAELIGRDKNPTTRAAKSRGSGGRGHERTAGGVAAATSADGERRLESDPDGADRDVHRARTHSNVGRPR